MDTPDSTTLKRCPKCGETKSGSEFNKNRSRKDGLADHCKTCCAAYRKANVEHINEYAHDYYHANPEKAREYRRVNADRRRAYSREYYWAHVEERREYRHKHYWANPDRFRKYARWYYQVNTSRIRQYCRSENGKTLRMAGSLRRRARKRMLENSFSSKDWQHAVEYFDGCCAVCGRPRGLWHTLSADHWIPVTKGGPTTRDNIVPLCYGIDGCNNSKNDRLPDEWLIEKFGARKGRAILRRIESYLESCRQV